ncbi:MAG: hypothetical protein LBH20_04330, partial [Treponema sp.]|nr:hypothetical protein [Treponema sp.]
YNFKYGSGGYQSDWAKFTLTLGAGLTLADYEKVTFTMQGIAGDTGSKNVALIAASPTLTISSDPRNGALDVGTTDPGVNGNTVQSIEIAINPTKAAGLSGTIEFCFYDHSGSNSSTTEWKISNVVFWFKNDS